MSRTGDDSKRPGRSARAGGLPPAEKPAQEEPVFISLRDVEPPQAPAQEPEPTDDGLVMSDLELQSEPWLGDPDNERAEQRAARRAQVRRDRLRDVATGDAPAAPETLVLSAVEAAASPLCGLLMDFGFRVRVSREPPALPAPWPFVAVFVDRALGTAEGGDAIDLCNQVRERSRLPGERKPVLLLVAEQLSATDRVRAGLAGCNELIVGEVTRGNVASALDGRGVALPSDARRS